MSRALARTEPALAPAREARPPAPARGGAWTVLRDAVASAHEHDATTTAQALAYSFFLAIPSLVLAVLGVFSLVARPADVDRLMHRLDRVLPHEASTLLGDSLQRATHSTHTGLT